MKRWGEIVSTLVFAAAAVGLAITAHRGDWAAWRWASLSTAAVAIAVGWVLVSDPIGTVVGRSRGKGDSPIFVDAKIGTVPATRLWPWIVGAIGLAVAAAVVYRWAIGETVFLRSLGWFAVVAAGIGAAEEVLWRGWMQGVLTATAGWPVGVLGAAASHAAYKTCLFVFPPIGMARQSGWSLGVMAAVTFGFGGVLGLIRVRQGTIAGPVAFHVAFDLLVYGACATAPWWVWS